MSILLKEEIKNHYNSGDIIIQPYNPEQLGPNSYDVRLGNVIKMYDSSNLDSDNSKMILDVKKVNITRSMTISDEGFVLKPGILYLGNTIEAIGSDSFIPMYEGRSSMARLGIQSHISAGFGDVGFKRSWTLEITVIHPVRIYAEMKIGQIYFHTINQEYNFPENRYNGKYNTLDLNQDEPQESKSYLDFNHNNNNSDNNDLDNNNNNNNEKYCYGC